MASGQERSPEHVAVYDLLNQHLGEDATCYKEERRWIAAQQLLEAGYDTEADLRGATREDLAQAGLPPVMRKAILRYIGVGEAFVHYPYEAGMAEARVELQDGTVDFAEFSRARNLQLASYAITDQRQTPEQVKQLDWVPFSDYWSIPVRPGAHVYLKAKPGPHWLIKAFMLL